MTNPAGDMIAARTLVDTLTWIDNGGEERFHQLADVLLGWKGKRIRDAIAETGVVHLGRRQTEINAQTDDLFLSRLARAGALVLDGVSLEDFIRSWLGVAPEDQAFRVRRLRALDSVLPILVKRHERNITPAALLIINAREELPARGLVSPQSESRRIDLDAHLVDHLYRQFARNDLQLSARLRQWITQNPDYVHDDKHKLIRSAALMGHWDIVHALFSTGHPYGITAPKSQQRLPNGAQRGELRTQLSDYLVERLSQQAPEQLYRLTQTVCASLLTPSCDISAMLEWLVHLARRAHQQGPQTPLRQAFSQVTTLQPQLQHFCHHNTSGVNQHARELLQYLDAQQTP